MREATARESMEDQIIARYRECSGHKTSTQARRHFRKLLLLTGKCVCVHETETGLVMGILQPRK